MSFVCGKDIAIKPTQWFWSERIPAGAITLLQGDPGCGKSTLLADLAARETQGLLMPGSDAHGGRGGVLWLSTEDTPATIRRNFVAGGGDLDKLFVFNDEWGDPLTLPADIARIEEAIDEYAGRLVIIDPAPAFIGGSAASDFAVRKALRPLTALAEPSGAAIVLVRHHTKSPHGSAMYKGAGSIAWSAVARSGLVVARDPSLAACDPQSRVLAPFKSSLGRPASALSFRLQERDDGVGVEWLGVSNYSPEELLAPPADDDRSKLMEACQVLYAILGAGPLPAMEAQQCVLQNGVKERTLQRAKERLGVRSIRCGFGPNAHYTWELPENNSILTQLRQAEAGNPDEAASLPLTDPSIEPESPLAEFTEPVCVEHVGACLPVDASG